ncbi:MAG: glycosyltransferase [Candidatus Promineifilaceae bacterium]
MRIGLVTACFEPVVNGVTRMVSLYRQHLEEAGHRVTIFTLGLVDQHDGERGIVRSPALPLGKTGYHLAVRYSRSAQKEMRQMDVLHCHHPLMGLEMAHRYGMCPVVFTNHTRYDIYLSAYSPLSIPASDKLMRQFWPPLTDFSDVVIAPSESVRKLLLAVGVRKPVELIVNGIDLSAFHRYAAQKKIWQTDLPGQPTRIIYVGRLSAEKNVLALLHEFARAYRVNHQLHLTLVGDGQQRRQLERLASELGIRSRTTFTGEVDYSNVPVILAKADIFATRSISEVHPLTIIEAMAIGLPIVATSSPGIDDIVEDGVTGLLGPDREGELARCLTALSMDPKRISRMGSSAFKTSSRYKIQNTVSRSLELYERLLAERPDLDRRSTRWQNRARRLVHSWQCYLPVAPRSRSRRSGRYEQ